MNVLVIVPTAVAGAEAPRYWRARTMPWDNFVEFSLPFELIKDLEYLEELQ
jgi:hypothetical protein